MIKHHPTTTILQRFVDGDLPVSVSIVVASHVEMCLHCQQRSMQLTEQSAKALFQQASGQEILVQSSDLDDLDMTIDEISMMDSITSIDVTEDKMASETPLPKTVTEIEINGTRIALPRAMKSIGLKPWQGFGKISRARAVLDDGHLKMSLLHIAKGGGIPTHTHNGFEITLLLESSFHDDMGEYNAGDFIWLDGKHTHSPLTEQGCVCLTVSSDAIHFTQGGSQLLNPIGKFIY
ncbi:transcriptional regulator [Vibrio sp. S11_S32]|uniref:ChrR family anti-sigma-E factor n=1 Tax=Vibrio sp. S11_S32 TaxID=2720225 RepID=UPI0016809C6C|nr:ChrR family anti-sigma-E factor [Vibrio sp. S11_S32]MBD1575767.1 transcriptional regulator [Vibrio sp. S11_S32]